MAMPENAGAPGLYTNDCLIIGGGPAGLTTALYLARFHRNALVIDAGSSRAAQIPKSHNHPGFSGISGAALLTLMRKQASQYGVCFHHGDVHCLHKSNNGFSASLNETVFTAPCVVLATGLTDIGPDFPGMTDAVSQAIIRYCPICDGYEATDKNVAVYGAYEDAREKALFLRTFTRNVTLLLTDTPLDSAELQSAGVLLKSSPPKRFWQSDEGIGVHLQSGEKLTFDAFYPALGCKVHSGLASSLGANCNPIGCIEVDDHQESSVSGLYAVGDVVSDLHQISVGEGHAAIAATAIHRKLPRNFR